MGGGGEGLWAENMKRFYRGPAFLAGPMIRLHAHPLPRSSVSKFDRRHGGRLRKWGNLLTREGGWKGWVWSRNVWPQESLAFYESFNTLWLGGRGGRGKGRKEAETKANMDETPAVYFSIHSLLPCFVPPPPSIEELNMYFFEYRKKLIAYKWWCRHAS